VVGTDLSPYAIALTRAKLRPPAYAKQVRRILREVAEQVEDRKARVDLRKISPWVRAFFHPDTLRETMVWFNLLKAKRSSFLLGCLLGILHHQRPGFLSYPSSNAVPYLRSEKFPKETFPEMYSYRNVTIRLEAKVGRMLKRVPSVDRDLEHSCRQTDSTYFEPGQIVDAIITSPPYMRRLAYGRDNRLRLWFLGVSNGSLLDKRLSPSETQFLQMMRTSLKRWTRYLKPGGRCVLILGDNYSTKYRAPLPKVISSIAVEELRKYRFESEYTERIPEVNRVRRDCRGNQNETILVLRAK